MFEHLHTSEKALIYRGLLNLVKTNSGFGFCNRDQGHPAYVVGIDGKYAYQSFGDSPDRNRLFKMMHELSVALCEGDVDGSSEIGEYVYSWCDFCRIAYNAYKEHTK